MKEILLIGGGGHCKSCIDVIEHERKFKIAGVIDNRLYENHVSEVLSYPVLGTDEDLKLLKNKYHYAFITIGQIKTPAPRINLFIKLKTLGYVLPVIISPLSHIAKSVKIGEGTIIMHHALINSSSNIGKMCIINTKALVEHDCKIEDFCHISTGAIVNGGCTIEEKTFIGTNMAIKHLQNIKKESIIYSSLLEYQK